MRMLYKYPQAAFPYAIWSRRTGAAAGDPEFELVDTGIFDEERYFDVEIEYAKAAPDDILMQVTVTNRGPDAATLHVMPQLWARNIWSWDPGSAKPHAARPITTRSLATHPNMPAMRFICDGAPELLFCDNETNRAGLFGQDGRGLLQGRDQRLYRRTATAGRSTRRGSAPRSRRITG